MRSCGASQGAASVGAIALLGLALAGGQALAQTDSDFFNDRVLHDIRFRINPSDWQKLRENFLDDDYYPCNFQWRNIEVQNVGIRSRGRGSRSPQKPGLRVDFNIYEDMQEFLGLKSIFLDNQTQDASMLKERLSMPLFLRMGVPAPREAHARIFINNEYAGLYAIGESVDKRFLKRHFGEDDGFLYEFKPRTEGYRFEFLGGEPARYSPVMFKPVTHEKDPNPVPLVEMIRAINQSSDSDFNTAMAEFLNLKRFVMHVGVENFLSEFDGILGDVFGMNNFYFYRLEKKKLSEFIGWDKDGAFEWAERPILHNTTENVLMRRALSGGDLRRAYLEAILKSAILAGGADGWLEQEVARMNNLIRQAAHEDTKKQCPTEGVLHSCSNQQFDAETARLRTFARERGNFVLAQVAAQGFQYAEGAPRLSEGGTVNAAPNAGALVSPGSLVSVYGLGLGEVIALAESVPLPTALAGVSIVINGFSAPLLFVSPGQVNIQVPWEIVPGNVPVTALVNGVPGSTVTATVGPVSPGIFAVVHADGALVSPQRPAGADDVLVIYANGLGSVDGEVPTGGRTPLDRLYQTVEPATSTIGGQQAVVLFSGLAPGFVGLYQLNLRVPGGVGAGARTPLVVSVGGRASPPTLIATR